MNYYRKSNGDKVGKSEIDRNVNKAKAEKVKRQYEDNGYNFCEKCNKEGQPSGINRMELSILDCSHNISVDECQKSGRSELAWDLDNIEILCRYHHQIKDGLDLKFKK